MRVLKGSTNVNVYFKITAGLTVTDFDTQYTRSGAAPSAKVDVTALGSPGAAHSDNAGIYVDATTSPGLFRLCVPDAAFVAGVDEVIVTLLTAAGEQESVRIELADLTAAAIRTEMDSNSTKLASIDGKTTNLPAAPASETNATANTASIISSVDANETKIDAIALQTTAIQAVTDLFSFTTGNVHSIPKAKDATVGLSTQEKTDAHAEALKVRSTDTMAELADMTDVPAQPTLEQAMMLTYMERRNGVTTTDSQHTIFNDAGSNIIEQDLSDDTFTATAAKLRDP